MDRSTSHRAPSDLALRSATPADVEAVVRIYVDSWNAGFGPLMPRIEVNSERIGRWREDLREPPPVRYWVAEREHAIVGLVGIRPSRDPIDPAIGELDTIAVAPASWRTGVGRALMALALEWLRADGYRSAVLWTLNDYPQGASFYESNGWRRGDVIRDAGRQVRYDHDLSA